MARPPRILMVVTSTRPSRTGGVIGDWATDQLAGRDDLEVAVADLRELGLPLLDEPHHPNRREYVHDHTKRWSALVDDADGFVFVVPEYNRGAPASLKNALDYLYHEWQHKPAGFVSYSGGVSGGTRAVEMAKLTMTALSMFPVPEMVNLPRVGELVVDGAFEPPAGAADALHAMADRLVRHVGASESLRVA